MKAIKRFICIFFLSLLSSITYGQEVEEEPKEEEGKHRITFMPSHTFIKIGSSDSQKWTALASYGLNYDYWIKENMAIGLHSDLVAESFIVSRFDDAETIERERPLALIGVFLYKFECGLTPLVGAGIELEKEEQLALIHLGMEYGVEFNKGWEVGGNMTYDLKVDVYNSFAFGISISKRL